MKKHRKLGLALFGAFAFAGNLVYANHLQAQYEKMDGGCRSYYCSSANPGVCGSSCGCGVGFGSPQCYGL